MSECDASNPISPEDDWHYRNRGRRRLGARRLLLAGLLCGSLLAPLALAQPLLELLGLTPVSAVPVDREYIEYVDLSRFLLESDEWWRQLALNPGEGDLLLSLEASPELLGLDIRGAQLLAFGQVPTRGYLLRVAYDPELLARAVGARGYHAVERRGVHLYVRGDGCGDIDLSAADPGDLFSGRLGKAVRLAALPSALAGACDPNVSDDILAAFAGEALSLGDAPAFRELAEMIGDARDLRLEQGSPVKALLGRSYRELAEAALDWGDPAQALLFGPGTGAYLGRVDPNALFQIDPDLPANDQRALLSKLMDADVSQEPLVPYGAALLADVGPGTHLLIGLHYATQESAEAAAPVLSARVEAFLAEKFAELAHSAHTHVRQLDRHDEATSVVIVEVTLTTAGNTAFRDLIGLLLRGEFTPVALP